jgi:hypothetical protein
MTKVNILIGTEEEAYSVFSLNLQIFTSLALLQI